MTYKIVSVWVKDIQVPASPEFLRCYDPSYDVVFKELFGSERNKDMLISLVNDAMNWQGEHEIQDVTFLNTEVSQSTPDEKGIRYDIRAIAKNGEQFIVEMQRKHEIDYEKRTVYYASKAYVLQLDEPGKEGRANDPRVKSYKDIRAVIVISILDHTLFKETPHFRNHYSTRDETSQRKLTGSPEYIYIELAKFVSKNHLYLTKDIEHMTGIERWAYVLKEAPNMQSIPPSLEGTAQGKALNRINRSKLTPVQREAWDMSILDQIAREQKIQVLEDRLRQAETDREVESRRAEVAEAAREVESRRAEVAEKQNQKMVEEIAALKRMIESSATMPDTKRSKF